jgi:hypothetical protein
LLATIVAAENYGTHNTIAVYGDCPLLITKAAVASGPLFDHGLKYAAQFSVIWQ